ncbi:sensor histidine kinase [Promicromonospora iranensis]|uniref:sensor histidine kinase n=1 Tax=Promicromonospora iranensis TaxID=1105144 RepID=UPI0023A99799|nr:histidine kinase [Promicromonospora iranensis]
MTPPTRIDTEYSPGNAAAWSLRFILAAVFAVLLVLAGVDPWWMLALAAVAAPLGLTDGGVRLGVVGMAVAVAAGAFAVLVGWADLRDALVTAARGVVTGVLPWSVAIAWRARRAGEADAARALLREQEARRMRAEADLARQRLQLAESLHDDLGHALSLVAVNLGRLELELERDPEIDRSRSAAGPESAGPESAGRESAVRESVGLARSQVSDAVARLGASVQTLRTGLADDAPSLPAEDIQAELDMLVQDARRAGADVDLTGSTGPDALAGFGPAVLRVVREGLTNALKHAPGQPVRVVLDAGSERLLITVHNPLPGSSDGSPTADAQVPAVGGTGVRSLTDHVRARGGSVAAGSVDGEYVLRAELPPVSSTRRGAGNGHAAGRPGTESEGTLSQGPLDADAVTHGLYRARRRGGALLLAAVLVPAAALVVVAAAIQLSDHLDARRARLDPETFARIAVGDARFDVRSLLPPATLDPPSGADPSCDYYAVTADPLADASGDAYRICWADGRVASTDLVVGGAR